MHASTTSPEYKGITLCSLKLREPTSKLATRQNNHIYMLLLAWWEEVHQDASNEAGDLKAPFWRS
ncbi:hypothetical protein KFK09_006472 [Dendrobium nobile]|uniref:Uncharacterized protein n=1 Tax=Dendrobium nobile TaxID=94219 RepID=A0A8T3BTZ9_DENNO|nr:hypothetical protein KFK09_006472 [Dendrobium nobile]